jgi:hypothetical protein
VIARFAVIFVIFDRSTRRRVQCLAMATPLTAADEAVLTRMCADHGLAAVLEALLARCIHETMGTSANRHWTDLVAALTQACGAAVRVSTRHWTA